MEYSSVPKAKEYQITHTKVVLLRMQERGF